MRFHKKLKFVIIKVQLYICKNGGFQCMARLVIAILLIAFGLIPKNTRTHFIIKLGKWSYLINALIYLIFALLIFWVYGLGYAVFAILVMIVAYVVDILQIKHTLKQVSAAKTNQSNQHHVTSKVKSTHRKRKHHHKA